MAKRPDRFQALAALPMQDPDMAARELERCVKEMGFNGALVNGFSQVGDPNTIVYYDMKQFWPFWATMEKLDVPFYLHPRNPLPQHSKIYEGHSWLMGPIWAFGQETAVHALRLMGSGLFDAYPKLNIILGHMGEGLPFSMWRVDNCNAWIPNRHNYPAKRKIGEYFQDNFYITTSGNFRTQALINTMLEIGVGPHHVLDRLAVREHRPCGDLVRCRDDQRGRPPQDRPHQRAEVVQAEGLSAHTRYRSTAAAFHAIPLPGCVGTMA